MIAAWQLAEARMEQGQPVAVAAAGLPERQRWILEGMAALHEGKPAQVAQVADAAAQAGHADIAGVLRALVEPPQEPPPVRLAEPLSALPDLLQRWARGGHPRGGKALRALTPRRPALQALLELTGRSAGDLNRMPGLAKLSPRAEGAFLAARGNILGWTHLRRSLDQLGDLAIDLSAARYPDLDADAGVDVVERWCAGLRVSEDDVEAALEHLQREPPDVRKAALGRLLDAMPRRLRAGGAASVFDTLEPLMALTRGLPELKALRVQIEVATQRIHPLAHPQCQEVDPLLGLFHLPLAPAERLVVAQALLGIADAPLAIARQAMALILNQGTPDQRAALLDRAGEAISRPELEDALKDTPPAEREYLLAKHALACQQPVAALRAAEALLRMPGEVDRGAEVLIGAWALLPDRPQSLVRERLVAAISALEGTDVSLARLAALVHEANEDGPAAARAAVQRVVRTALERPVAPEQMGYAIGLELATDQPQRATERVRALAPALRALGPEAADDLALDTLAQATTALLDRASSAKTTLAPLWARLNREGGVHLPPAIVRATRAPSPTWTGLCAWLVLSFPGRPPDPVMAAMGPLLRHLEDEVGLPLFDDDDDAFPVPF